MFSPCDIFMLWIRNVFHFMCRIRRKPFWWSERKSISNMFCACCVELVLAGCCWVFLSLTLSHSVSSYVRLVAFWNFRFLSLLNLGKLPSAIVTLDIVSRRRWFYKLKENVFVRHREKGSWLVWRENVYYFSAGG